jgi:hypothetical protein
MREIKGLKQISSKKLLKKMKEAGSKEPGRVEVFASLDGYDEAIAIFSDFAFRGINPFKKYVVEDFKRETLRKKQQSVVCKIGFFLGYLLFFVSIFCFVIFIGPTILGTFGWLISLESTIISGGIFFASVISFYMTSVMMGKIEKYRDSWRWRCVEFDDYSYSKPIPGFFFEAVRSLKRDGMNFCIEYFGSKDESEKKPKSLFIVAKYDREKYYLFGC